MTTITLNTDTLQDSRIQEYLETHNISLDELVTDLILEKIEDEEDLQAGLKGLAAYKAGGETGYTLSEAKELLGL